MKRGPSRSFVRPDTGSSLLRRVEDPSDSVEDGTPPRPPTAPPPTAPPPVPAPAPPPTSENSDQLDREEIFTRISTSTISLKPVVPNRRSFSNARVGSYVPVKPKNSSNDKEGDKSDNVSGKISVAYSMVSVDSVDSVDTVNSVRIDESKAEPTVYANNRDQESNDQKPSVLPKTSPLVQKSSSDTKDLIKVKEARNGEATLSNSSSSSTTSSIPVTNSLPALKKKPELKAKPKIAKVIPVVKSVSTTVIKPNGPVGFSSLPKQLHRRALRRGFEFSLMVVGESGLGKSTLINSMFLTNVYSSSLGKTSKPEQTLEVESHSILLEEAGVKLSLTVLDTPGFGDKLDNANCWYPISCYIEEQFDKFLEAETRVNRVRLADTRVHACLYFIAPSGHRLKELDIEFMRKLCGKVNIIPVIGKSDSLTKEELGDFKQRIRAQLKEHQISIYDFSLEEGRQEDKWMRDLTPFAVVGSNTIIQDASGKKVRGRSYPWGSVNIEDRRHCDFQALRKLLLSHHLQDLKETTCQQHYENYRTKKLTEIQQKNKGEEDLPNKNPLAAMEDERLEHDQKVLQMALDMESVFRRKVDEKEERMNRMEKDEGEKVESIKKEVEDSKSELEKKREELIQEKKTWERENSISLEDILLAGTSDSLRSKKKHRMTVNPLKFSRI